MTQYLPFHNTKQKFDLNNSSFTHEWVIGIHIVHKAPGNVSLERLGLLFMIMAYHRIDDSGQIQGLADPLQVTNGQYLLPKLLTSAESFTKSKLLKEHIHTPTETNGLLIPTNTSNEWIDVREHTDSRAIRGHMTPRSLKLLDCLIKGYGDKTIEELRTTVTEYFPLDKKTQERETTSWYEYFINNPQHHLFTESGHYDYLMESMCFSQIFHEHYEKIA